jgi:hypothetical protein
VIPTRPAKAPFRANDVSGFVNKTHEVIIAAIAPPLAAKFVVTAMKAKSPF